jgi:hypothetical protein
VTLNAGQISHRAGLDLRGFSFHTYVGRPETAEALLQAQIPVYFSRDPYIELEKFYNRTGNEADARRIYYLGHCHLRERACSASPTGSSDSLTPAGRPYILPPTMGTRWTRRQRTVTWINQKLTGYGVHTERLLVPILLTLIVGTAVFGREGALVAPSPSATSGTIIPESRTYEQGSVERLFVSAGYSIDLFSPLDLGMTSGRKPNRPSAKVYAVVHALLGWLLVPLLIASIAGIVKRHSSGSSTPS